MDIIIASHSGLCYGVKRALALAKQTRRRRSGRVLTLGELIHNPRVIADLEALGLESVDDPADVGEGTVVIRSHGVAPAVYRALKKKGIEVVDATCPIVKRIQQLVEGLARRQAEIVIVGDPDHPEIRGLLGYSRGRGRIVENEAQARSLPRRQHRAVLAQSTQDALLFGRVVAALLERTDKLEVYNTICRSTQTRQKATSDLAGRVDVLFIVGGRNSSNTHKLYEISKRILPRTYFVESASQITPRLLKQAEVVGISGGASTPPEAIDEAVAKIRNSFEHSLPQERSVPCQS